jgi:hypothetical protein
MSFGEQAHMSYWTLVLGKKIAKSWCCLQLMKCSTSWTASGISIDKCLINWIWQEKTSKFFEQFHEKVPEAQVTCTRCSITIGISSLLSWYTSCHWWRVWFLVVPFPPCGPPRSGCLLAWTSILAPCFFSSPFLWVPSFYKVWQGFICLFTGI